LFHTTAQETKKYATFRYDTVEVENRLKAETHVPDTIRQRGAIFQFFNKTANKGNFERHVDRITQNVKALLNI
jgi:hypothetical protein